MGNLVENVSLPVNQHINMEQTENIQRRTCRHTGKQWVILCELKLF